MHRILSIALVLLAFLCPSLSTAQVITQGGRPADLTDVKNVGAQGNTQLTSVTATIAAASSSLSVGSATFASSDVGKVIVIQGAGTTPASGYVQTVPVATPGAGYTSVPTCAVSDTGSGTGAACSALMSLVGATLATGGTGCLASSTLTLLVGTDGTGTPPQITVTTNGSGVVTAVGAVSVAGQQSALGTLSGSSGYGGNCTAAPTFNLSYGVSAIYVSALGASYSLTGTTAALSGGSPSSAATLGTPNVAAPVPPLVTTIAGYTSPTQITLSATAATAISGATTQIIWGTNDYQAFQNAINVGSGIWIPAGVYWLGSSITVPQGASIGIRGAGMNNTVLIGDTGNGTIPSIGQPGYNPMFVQSAGSAGSPSGNVQVEDLQFRGLLDLGRVNVGAPILYLDNLFNLNIDRVKFYQIQQMAIDGHNEQAFTVTNSLFDSVMIDQARCISCFSARIIGNKFVHSADDSVALHQSASTQGPGLIREAIVVEGNEFEDTAGVHILGARNAVVRGNVFRRTKLWAINLSWDSAEGANQLRSLIVADNAISDVLTRIPLTAAACAICFSVKPPVAPTSITSQLPGTPSYPGTYVPRPWDYDLANNTLGTAFAPSAIGVSIHDNIIMRTLKATANYSAWGFGQMLDEQGFIDPPVTDTVLVPTAGIAASVNVPGLNIHHNDVQNVRRGISLNDNIASPSQASASISFNHLFDTWEYGIVGLGTGNFASLDIVSNVIDVDPYLSSPGRHLGNAWNNGYSVSKCLSLNYTAPVNLTGNTFSDCYTLTVQATWVAANNILRGNFSSGSGTGQPNVWGAANTGIGVFTTIQGQQYFLSSTAATTGGNPPATYGAVGNTHVWSAAAAPSSGYHTIGDIIWSTAPGTCTCTGWLALTTGSAWTAGTDYKVIPIQ